MKILKLLSLFLVFFVIISSASALNFIDCSCSCNGETIEITEIEQECLKLCAKRCGRKASYEKDLNEDCNNCADYCNGLSNLQSDTPNDISFSDARNFCINSCEKTCGTVNLIKDIALLVRNILLVLAAIAFIYYGYQFILTDVPEKRNKIKLKIIYVILALIVIALAEPLATQFLL